MKVKVFAILSSLFIVSSLVPAFAGQPPEGSPEGGGTIGTPTNSLSVRLMCDHTTKDVGGTIYITNSTQNSIPAGTSISWSIPKNSEKGAIQLTEDLQPGGNIPKKVFANATGGKLPCYASYLKLN